MKHSRINVLMRLNLLVLLVVLLLMNAACVCINEPLLFLKVENSTDQTLTIYVNDKKAFDVEAGKTVKGETGIIRTIAPDYINVRAQDSEGKVYFSKRYTLDELMDIHYKITILPPSE